MISAIAVMVTATSVADSWRSGSATVTLSPPVTVTVNPGSAMNASQTQQFTASVGNSDNPNVTWSVVSGPGAINAYGLYTSPSSVSSAVSVIVKAVSVADPTKSGTTTITVNPWPAGSPYSYYVSDNFAAIDA